MSIKDVKYKFQNWFFEHFASMDIKYTLIYNQGLCNTELDEKQNELNQLQDKCKSVSNIPGEQLFVEGDYMIMPSGGPFSEKHNICYCCKNKNECLLRDELTKAEKDCAQAEKMVVNYRRKFVNDWWHGRLY